MHVVWRDRFLLVVDKPAGLPTQSARSGEPDLFTQVRRAEPQARLHHRLDQPASGLVLFTLDRSIDAAIADAFRDHTIRRTYRAVLAGAPPDAIRWEWPVDGKTARTDGRIVGRGEGQAAAEFELHTGRTHQIRIHASLAGTPIVGDRRYGGEPGGWWPRLALHAWRLALRHPAEGRDLVLEAPLPADLAQLWRLAGGPTSSTG